MDTERTETDLKELSSREGLLYGFIGGLVMVLITVVLRLGANAVSIAELAADQFTVILPGEIIDFLLSTLQFSAKPLMMAGILLLQTMLGTIGGAAYTKILPLAQWDARRQSLTAILLAIGLWALFLATLVPWMGGGFFGTRAPGDPFLFIAGSFVEFVVYGAVVGGLVSRHYSQKQQSGIRDDSRRAFLQKLSVWSVLAVIAAVGAQAFFNRFGGGLTPSASNRRRGKLSTEITPNDEFYVISKNLVDPTVNLDAWKLEIGGLVSTPYSLTYAELISLPFVHEFVTLECISNEIGGDLISNARWKGVRLRDLLEKAGLSPGVVDISFGAWDSYTESIPVEMAMRDEVIVAYEMNGQPLPQEHGFPARLLVPGFFGLKGVKWLSEINPVDNDFQGFWQERGWTDTPHVKTFSRFDIPRNRTVFLADSITLGGVAFSGRRGISKVEISDDGGRTWMPAENISTPLSPFTWVIWTTTYTLSTPDEKKSMSLRVRATDADGAVQTGEWAPTIPDGASGYHEIVVIFRDDQQIQ